MSAAGVYTGMIDIDEYRCYDNPCSSDLHMAVPPDSCHLRGPSIWREDRIFETTSEAS